MDEGQAMGFDKIEVTIEKRMRCVPERIVFQTAFVFDSIDQCERELPVVHRQLVSFLNEQKVVYEGPRDIRMYRSHFEHGDFEYSYPEYTIELNRQAYRLLTDYQIHQPRLKGSAIKTYFSLANQQEFLNEVTAQAQAEAQALAQQRKLSLLVDAYQMTEKVEEEGDWKVFPPPSAPIDAFQGWMEGKYTFIFQAQKS